MDNYRVTGIIWENLGNIGMDELTGEYDITLDDTGRISLPRRLRDMLEEDNVVVTKGADRCIWLFTNEEWDGFKKGVYRRTDQFSARGRRQRQHFIGAMQKLDIDNHGRILIPPPLRDHAGLFKECKIFGQGDYVEIWNKDRYLAYLDASEDDFKAGLEEMSVEIKKEKELENGDHSHAGSAG
jgi:MraZ protein